MDKLDKEESFNVPLQEAQLVPGYEPPRVVSYSGADIIERLGPAHTCSYIGSVAPLCS